MQVSAFPDLFSFKEINFMKSHHTNLSHGIKHNHIGYIKK